MKTFIIIIKLCPDKIDYKLITIRAIYCDTYTDTADVRWLHFYDEEDVLIACFREDLVVCYYNNGAFMYGEQS